MLKNEFVTYEPGPKQQNSPLDATDWLFIHFIPIDGKELDRKLVLTTLRNASYLSPEGFNRLVSSMFLGYESHRHPCKPGKELRRDKSLYISHPVEVANILAEEGAEESILVAAPVHDALEDTHLIPIQLAHISGIETLRIVFPVTKITGSEDPTQTEEKLLKMALETKGGKRDLRSILLKLADRLHNMRTLYYLDSASQKRIALQTWELFAPLAELFGMGAWANELFSLSGKYLWPEQFDKVLEVRDKWSTEKNANLLKTAEAFTQVISSLSGMGMSPSVIPASHDTLSIIKPIVNEYQDENKAQENIEIHLPKTVPYYMVLHTPEDYEKLKRYLQSQELSWESVENDDSNGLNVDFAYGNQIFHIMVRDLSSYLTDQTSLLDLYRSYLPEKDNIVGFGRNDEMIKIRRKIAQSKMQRAIEYIEQTLLSEETEGTGSVTKMRLLREKMRLPSAETNLIGVTTKDGDRRVVPYLSTALDFAFDIWDKLGLSASYAIVNGERVDLSYQLRDGDSVEIMPVEEIPHNPQEPVRRMVDIEWLDWVKIPSVKFRIQSELGSILNIKSELDKSDTLNNSPVPNYIPPNILRAIKKFGYKDGSSFKIYAEKLQMDAQKKGMVLLIGDQSKFITTIKPISDLRKGWGREINQVNRDKYSTFERFLEMYGIGLVLPDEKKIFFDSYKEYLQSLPTYIIDTPNQKGYLALLTTILAPFVDIQDIEIQFPTQDVKPLHARILIRGEVNSDIVDNVETLVRNLETYFMESLTHILERTNENIVLNLPLLSDGDNSILFALTDKFGLKLKNYSADFSEGICRCEFISEPDTDHSKPIEPEDVLEIIRLLRAETKYNKGAIGDK